MALILFVSTLVLTLSGVLFSILYLIINVRGTLSDLPVRNKALVRITRSSMILSLVFAFLTGLLSGSLWVEDAAAMSSFLYGIIALAWMAVILVTGVVMVVALVSRKPFSATLSATIKRIFMIALIGAVVALVFAFLLS